jgi:RimJ/RimL family protein N-acetyltransferase
MMHPEPTPELLTRRLRLRGWTEEDVERWARITAEPDVMRYVSVRRPLTSDEARAEVRRLSAAWRREGIGHWAVEELQGGLLVGRLGLERHLDWKIDPRAVEVGWILAQEAWGNGYATEGGAAALRFGFEVRGCNEIISITDPANRGSLRVMQKLGLSYRGKTEWRRHDVVWYSITVEAWRKRAPTDSPPEIGLPDHVPGEG